MVSDAGVVAKEGQEEGRRYRALSNWVSVEDIVVGEGGVWVRVCLKMMMWGVLRFEPRR